jgi:hypothetical protein
MARAMLAHANAQWSNSITANLWPYAIQNAGDAINHTPSMQDADRRSPIKIFLNSKGGYKSETLEAIRMSDLRAHK